MFQLHCDFNDNIAPNKNHFGLYSVISICNCRRMKIVYVLTVTLSVAGGHKNVPKHGTCDNVMIVVPVGCTCDNFMFI